MIRSVVSRVHWPLRSSSISRNLLCSSYRSKLATRPQLQTGARVHSTITTSHDEIWGKGTNDYSAFVKKREKVLDSLLNGPDRFQRISEREDRCDMPIEAIKVNCMGRYFITHRGCQMVKDSNDLIILQLLLWYLRPATVIELGDVHWRMRGLVF